LKAIVHEVKGLAQPIPPIELQRAKNITKSNILMALERQKDRLEEAVKNVRLAIMDWIIMIDSLKHLVTWDLKNIAIMLTKLLLIK